jgi:hypothetical protein
MSERKDDHAVEIDVLKAHRRDVPQQFRVDFSTGLPLPEVEGPLQMTRVIGHHEIRADREAVRLGAEFLLTLTPSRSRAAWRICRCS